MHRRSILAALLLAPPVGLRGLSAEAGPAAIQPIDWDVLPVRLMMVERQGCVYCAAWWREIGPGFATSAEGRIAPLLTVQLDGPYPDGIVFDRRPWLTPTFVLLQKGIELERIEGYVGQRNFYPVLRAALVRHGLA